MIAVARVEARAVLCFVGLTVFRLIGGVCIGHAGCFKGKADKLAAPWNCGPVEELVWWVSAGFVAGSHGVEALDGCYTVSNCDRQRCEAARDE